MSRQGIPNERDGDNLDRARERFTMSRSGKTAENQLPILKSICPRPTYGPETWHLYDDYCDWSPVTHRDPDKRRADDRPIKGGKYGIQ